MWTQFDPSPPKPWKIEDNQNAFQPSMAQPIIVKTKSSGIFAFHQILVEGYMDVGPNVHHAMCDET
jgi:hypothetical protein